MRTLTTAWAVLPPKPHPQHVKAWFTYLEPNSSNFHPQPNSIVLPSKPNFGTYSYKAPHHNNFYDASKYVLITEVTLRCDTYEDNISQFSEKSTSQSFGPMSFIRDRR